MWAVFDLYGKCDEISVVNNAISHDETYVKETGVKEEKESKNLMTSSLKMEELPQQISRHCEYLVLCQNFKDTLGLPNVFFDMCQITCYCETCHKLRHEDVIQLQGQSGSRIFSDRFLTRSLIKNETLMGTSINH